MTDILVIRIQPFKHNDEHLNKMVIILKGIILTSDQLLNP